MLVLNNLRCMYTLKKHQTITSGRKKFQILRVPDGIV